MAELDLFSKRPIQTDIEDVNYVYYYPLVNPTNNSGPIEFFIPGNSLYYLDLYDTSLGIHVKVKNGTDDLAADVNIAPVNNWLHSLFSDVSLTLNDTLVEGGNHLYPYKAYLTNLLLYGDMAKKCQLQTSGWAKDESGKMKDATNSGFVTRKAWISTSKTYEMEGPLLLDLFMQRKFLLPQVDMRIKLTRSHNTFNLISLGDNAVKGSVDISKAYIKVKQVQVAPDRVRQLESGMGLQNAIYPIQRTEMCTYTISKGIQSHIQENLFQSRRPKLLVLGMLPNSEYNGTYESNPFRFPHLNLNYIGVYIDGKSVPQIPLQPNFADGDFVEVYRNLYRLVDMANRDGDISITKNEFVNGYTLHCYILSPDGKPYGNMGQPLQNGNIRIELKFKAALTNAINVICMACYDDEVQISRLRQVTVDYRN